MINDDAYNGRAYFAIVLAVLDGLLGFALHPPPFDAGRLGNELGPTAGAMLCVVGQPQIPAQDVNALLAA
ncbi:hypothetical protein [Nocardia testacea]|uniref:hypothetical protein n=1 Tax=Nocardia testacea TaxID=248551 RepID=UPI0033D89ADB